MMDEQIYKLTDKGLMEFERRLFRRSEEVCGINMIDISEVQETLLEIIEWDNSNVRAIEVNKTIEENNNEP